MYRIIHFHAFYYKNTYVRYGNDVSLILHAWTDLELLTGGGMVIHFKCFV